MKIFFNANIYAPQFPKATALAVDNGYIIALGSDVDIISGFGHFAQSVNLEGKTLWPGLTDAHIHVRLLAESLAMVDCEVPSIQECLSRVKAAAESHPDEVWVRGHGWNQNQWKNGFGTAQMLDAVSEEHPVYLTAKSLHAAWVNSLALKLAGINQNTPDPPGGLIHRDDNGLPTGILFEAGAMNLVESVIPKPSPTEIVAKINSLLPQMWQVGLVGVHDFDDVDCWTALQTIYQQGPLPIRIRKHIPFDHLDDFIRAGLRTGFGDDRLNLGGVKLFSDGALGPQTAAMLAPFENAQSSGSLLMTEDELVEVGEYAANHGIFLAVHAIGDRANHVVLNAFERLRTYEENQHLPHFQHRIEHVQIIDPEDIPRLAKLDIIASVQPVHAPSDMLMADHFLGERSKNAYAYRSMIESDAPYVLGSDAPVEPFNPFHGLHAAVTRCRLDGSPADDGWHPEQRLSLEQALKGFTHMPAVISGKGASLGKISPGYHADFILLETDPFQLNPHQLGAIEPLATLIDGECMYQSTTLPFDLSD
jgi:hypothetical protein